jgi:ribose transport system ATP-binding protein
MPTEVEPVLAARIELRNVSVRFGATQALNNVSFSVEAGAVHALIGENGAGKSTLMKVLAGALPADSGVIVVDGTTRVFKTPLEARRAGVSMIYQELSLAPHLSAVENIFLGMELLQSGMLDRHAMREEAELAIEELEHSVDLDLPVGELSISDRQIIEIARAAALGCRILILDEPTSSLTQHDVQRLFRLIRKLKEKGHSIIYISHFLEEVQDIADCFTVLRDGQTVGGGRITDVSADQIVSLMLGRDLKDLYPRSTRQPGEIILEVEQLSSTSRLTEASLKLHRAEVLGIFGLVGSGRTELMRAIFGLDKVSSGQIKVAGFCGLTGIASRWQQGIGMVSEDRKNEGLAVNMSIAENIILSHTQTLGNWGLLWPAKKIAAARTWIEQLSIRCRDGNQKASELSGGNQQKIAIARLLHHDVDVFLLDEPTRGIDLGSKTQIYQLIDNLARSGKAVLVVSSYLPELLGICDRIAVMRRGNLLPAKKIEELSAISIMMEATTGSAERRA